MVSVVRTTTAPHYNSNKVLRSHISVAQDSCLCVVMMLCSSWHFERV